MTDNRRPSSRFAPAASAAVAGRTGLGELPEWNLADLYPAPDSASLRQDVDRADRDTKDFAVKWRGRPAGLPGGELAAAIAEYEALSDLVGRIGSYATLHYVGDTTDAARQKFYGDINQKLNDFTTRLIFFELELNRINDKDLENALKAILAGRKPDRGLDGRGARAASRRHRPRGRLRPGRAHSASVTALCSADIAWTTDHARRHGGGCRAGPRQRHARRLDLARRCVPNDPSRPCD